MNCSLHLDPYTLSRTSAKLSPVTNIVLKEGDLAPEFSLENQNHVVVELKSLLKNGPTVIYFYPKDFTPGCTTEACDFRDLSIRFDSAGYQIVGISPDDPEKHKKFIEEYNLTFDLLSDPTKEVMTMFGAFGEKMNYGKVVQGVIRSTFVIQPDRTISSTMYAIKAKGHAERVAKLLPTV